MICNRIETGWEMVYQRAHGLLAAQLLTPWREPERPARWTELLTATAQHDNGWQEWEAGAHLTPLNTPLDFTDTPVDDLVAQSERAVRRAWHQSLWSGLLVSTHVDHLYGKHQDEALKTMLRHQRDLRRSWRRVLGVLQKEVDADYSLLRWADTFSLVLCCRNLPFGERRIEIETVGATRYHAWERADASLGVEPWPYEKKEFEVGVDVYHLHQLTFESQDELAAALEKARPARRTWTLRRT